MKTPILILASAAVVSLLALLWSGNRTGSSSAAIDRTPKVEAGRLDPSAGNTAELAHSGAPASSIAGDSRDVRKKPVLPDDFSAKYQEYRDRHSALWEEYSVKREVAVRAARLEALDVVSATVAERDQMLEVWEGYDQANAKTIQRSGQENLSPAELGQEFVANQEALTEQEQRVLGESRWDQYAEAYGRLYESTVLPIDDEGDRLLEELENEALDHGVTTNPLPPRSLMLGP